jgi:heme-degrading monooxygenase HmoA
MVTIVTDIQLKDGTEREWDTAMRERMAAVKKQPGWVGGQMLQPEGESSRRLIIGTWRTHEDWKSWHEDPEFDKTRKELAGLTAAPEQHAWHEVVLDVRSPKAGRSAEPKRRRETVSHRERT